MSAYLNLIVDRFKFPHCNPFFALSETPSLYLGMTALQDCRLVIIFLFSVLPAAMLLTSRCQSNLHRFNDPVGRLSRLIVNLFPERKQKRQQEQSPPSVIKSLLHSPGNVVLVENYGL
jgi:hypothetical protein